MSGSKLIRPSASSLFALPIHNTSERGDRIEPGIRPLVDALNGWHEFETFASCEGHVWRQLDPYVAFRIVEGSPFGAALETLETLSWKTHLAAASRLSYFWELQAWFHPDGGLAFAIRAPALRDRLWWRRSAVRRDIRTLAVLWARPTASNARCIGPREQQAWPQSDASSAR